MFSPEKLAFFDRMEADYLGLTFDDVRVETARSHIAKEDIDLTTQITRNVSAKMPFMSAAMDTVTTAGMAIEMARLGGIGVIHSALSPEEQKREVRTVKLKLNGQIDSPVTYFADQSLADILRDCEARRYDFRTFPIINRQGTFVGLLTQNDFDFSSDKSTESGEAMTPSDDVIHAGAEVDAAQAYAMMIQNKKKTLPILGPDGSIVGMYLWSDVNRIVNTDLNTHNLDARGRLRVAAAVPTDDTALERLELMAKYLDVVVIDSSQGDSKFMFETLKKIKDQYGDQLDVIAGNITNPDSARQLVEAGADGIKVGQGGGSICTTREKTGTGTPQLTAVYRVARAIANTGVPVISDGGIRNTGDTVLAIAAGADTIMMGRVLAAHKESAGETVRLNDGSLGKIYRGMGSIAAMKESAAARARYGVDFANLRPEGVESFVPMQGVVADTLKEYIDYLRRGMSLAGTESVKDHQARARFMRITNAGLKESHAHDVAVI